VKLENYGNKYDLSQNQTEYWPYDQAFKQWQANRSGNTTPYHLPFVEIRKNGEDYVRIESRYARIISDGLKTKRT